MEKKINIKMRTLLIGGELFGTTKKLEFRAIALE